MIFICVICSAKRPPLMPLEAEQRQLLDAVLAPVINIVDLKSCLLLHCPDCKLLMESIHNFQQRALVGVSRLKYLIRELNKPQTVVKAEPLAVTIKTETSEFKAPKQEFVAVKHINPLTEEYNIKYEPDDSPDCQSEPETIPDCQPETVYDSESTVSCDSPKPEELKEDLKYQVKVESRYRNWNSKGTVSKAKGFKDLKGQDGPMAMSSSQSREPSQPAEPIKSEGNFQVFTHQTKPKPQPGPYLTSIRWKDGVNDLESNVQREENQRSPIPPSPAMYVEFGGSANSTPSSGYQFNVQMSIDDNFSASNIANRKHHLREEEKIERSPKRERRSLYEERPQLAVTSSVAASSSEREGSMIRVFKKNPLACPHCGKTIINKECLQRHIAVMHGELAPCNCEVCGKQYRNQMALKIHQKKHVKKLKTIDDLRPELYCSQCQLQSQSPAAFRLHMTTLKHMSRDQYDFQCDVCKNRFPSKMRLQTHMDAVHLDQRKHKCDRCNKSYVNASCLQQHIKSAHEKATKLPTHVCHLCGRAFTVKKSLEEHLNIHAGLRPHQCPRCPATFTYKAALYMHNRLKHLKIKGKWKKKKVGVKKKGKEDELEKEAESTG